ncbi:MAG: hypothetical protein MUQ65_13550 [Armatimonadetes bacterium]|nr:hypothetical protein [Armatimonadota bacterium]
MAEDETRGRMGDDTKAGRDFRDLSMNEVPASATADQNEEPRRGAGVGLIALGVLVAAALIVLGARLISNAAPGQEAEDRLRQKLSSLPVWQRGVVLEAGYAAGNKVRLELAPSLRVEADEGRSVVRGAVQDVMDVLMKERPGRDLYIDGYQGEEKIVTAEYRAKSTLVGPGGERIADIVVRVEGDPEGGMGQAYGRVRSGGGR